MYDGRQCYREDAIGRSVLSTPTESLPVVQLREAGMVVVREAWRAPRGPATPRGEGSGNVCFAFNEGTCKFGPDFQFEHQCTVCKVYGGHGSIQCKKKGRRETQRPAIDT